MPLGFEEGFKNKDCTKILFFCPALVSRFTLLNFLNVLLCTEMLKFFHSVPFNLNYNDACFAERIKKWWLSKNPGIFQSVSAHSALLFFLRMSSYGCCTWDPGQPFYHPKKIAMTLSRRTLEKRSSKIRSCWTYRRKSARQPRRGTRIDASPCLRH